MQNATRYIAAAVSAIFLAVALVLVVQKWLNGEEISLLLPCLLAGVGASLFGFVLFYPFASLEQGSCSADQSDGGSDGSEGELREVDS
jgi:hypothetical protein